MAGTGLVATPPAIVNKAGFSQPVWSPDGAKVITTFEEQLVMLINDARQSHASLDGEALPPLKREALLDQVAESHSQSMASNGFVAHCDLQTTSTPDDRLAVAGYQHKTAGESIVAGYQDAASVLDALMASPGSKDLLLSRDLWEIGVGFVHDENDLGDVERDLDEDCSADLTGSGPYYFYWTVLLGQRGDAVFPAVFPVTIDRENVETPTSTVDLFIYGEGWATQMMLWNEGGTPTTWITFEEEYTWLLSSGSGEKKVYVRVRNGFKGESADASDTIVSTVGISFISELGFESGDTTGWEVLIGKALTGEEEQP